MIYLCALNNLVSVLAVYLLFVYGNIHQWYQTSLRVTEGLRASQTPLPVITDQLHFIAMGLAALGVIANLLFWKLNLVKSRVGVVALVFSSMCLLVCVLIRF